MRKANSTYNKASRKYYMKNRDRILLKQKERYSNNKEKIKIWREEHKEEIKLRSRAWREKNKQYHVEYTLKWRHRKGISKKYKSDIVMTKKQHNQIYKKRVRMGGKLSIETLQKVYEDNIKQYGTLTCYLCLLPILFGKDSLEHKTPLSRGGTNEYNNLGVACRSCNSKKHNKTEKEYKMGVLA